MIVLDLEWNRGYDNKPLNEILQIGAVRIEELGGPVVDTFNIHIRPVVHKRFDPGARNLPELQASLDSQVEFAEAMERFRAWCGTETHFASWGGDDRAAIAKNCEYWNLPPFPMETLYNLQGAFSVQLGAEQQVALWRAADYCKIPDTFTFHNALHDALYAAILSRWLTQEALDCVPAPARRSRPAPPKVKMKLSRLPFSKQPRKTVGPLPAPELVLNARDSRKPRCPVCGRCGCVSRWYLAPVRNPASREGFSIFSCPSHGRFLYRAALSRLENGMWRGRFTIPTPGPEWERAYSAAVLRGRVYICGRPKPRRSGRASAPDKEPAPPGGQG